MADVFLVTSRERPDTGQDIFIFSFFIGLNATIHCWIIMQHMRSALLSLFIVYVVYYEHSYLKRES